MFFIPPQNNSFVITKLDQLVGASNQEALEFVTLQ